MRRKSTGPQATHGLFDVLTGIQPEKLQTFAAIMIVWNFIEEKLNRSLGYTVKHPELIPEITTRINGIDGKIEIIKELFRLRCKDDEPLRHAAAKTLNAVFAYKRIRDGLAHVKIPERDAEVAETIQRQGVTDQMLISLPALTALYQRLCILKEEMDNVWYALDCFAMAEVFTNDVMMKKHFEERVQQCLVLLRLFQTEREELPPLPEFPDQPQVPPNSEAAPKPPGSGRSARARQRRPPK